jgi:hypothetical protein
MKMLCEQLKQRFILPVKTSNKFRSMIFSTDCSISFPTVLA